MTVCPSPRSLEIASRTPQRVDRSANRLRLDSPQSLVADLLSPVSEHDFFHDNWEKSPLLVAGRGADYYTELLTPRDVEGLLQNVGLHYPAVRLARDGGYLPANLYTRDVKQGDVLFAGLLNLPRVEAEYRAGATILLTAMGQYWPPARTLTRICKDYLSHRVHINGYVAPPHSVGFPAHHDPHEVFILQISGLKQWRIYAPYVHLPHASQRFDSRRFTPGKPIIEVTLAPGDLLYLPRGYVHETSTSSDFSLHLTMGVTVYSWVDVALTLAAQSRESDALRQGLPPGFLRSSDAAVLLWDEFASRIRELVEPSSGKHVVDRFMREARLLVSNDMAPIKLQ